MPIIGGKTEKRMQLHHYDDDSLEFRNLPIEEASFFEKKNGERLKGWPHFFNTQIPFEGYHRIPRGMVTLSFDRDIVLDPWGLLSPEEKPEQGEDLVKPWITKRAETQRYKKMSRPGQLTNIEKVIMWLGISLIIIVLFAGLKAVT